MNVKGVIFDLDGTILDSTWVWGQIDIDFLAKYGFEVPEDYAKAISAMGFGEAAKYTIERFQINRTVEEVMEEWNQMAMEAYKEKVSLKSGTKELLQWLTEEQIPFGVATSNNESLFGPCLKRNGVYDMFHSFTESSEVKRGKEFPDIYERAAEKLSRKPEECIVFEDIIPALKAAASGGFVTMGVWEPEGKYDKKEFQDACDFMVTDISDALSLLKTLK